MTKKELEKQVEDLLQQLANKDKDSAAVRLSSILKNFFPTVKLLLSTAGSFIDRHFFVCIFFCFLFCCIINFKGVDTSNWFKFDWLLQSTINNSLIHKAVPDEVERDGFIKRIQKLFENDYQSDEQFQSDYKQTTADYRWRYPKLREADIKNKDDLANFIKGK